MLDKVNSNKNNHKWSNKKKSTKLPQYGWTFLKTNPEICNIFVTLVSKIFDALQDSPTTKSANMTSNNFENACNETGENTIPLKPKLKKQTAWESEISQKKKKELHKAATLSAVSWEIIYKISGRKSSNRSKLKASRQEKRLTLWQKQFAWQATPDP